MAFVSRGKPRTQIRAVACTGAIYHGFKTKDLAAIAGVSAPDLVALGQKQLSEVGNGYTVVFGAQSPVGARFRKQLSRNPQPGVQGSVSSFGNGSVNSAIATAATAGWSLVRGVRLTTVRSTAKSISVGVPLSNGLIYVQPVPVQDQQYAEALGWKLPATFGSADRAKAVRGANNLRPAKVTRIDPDTGISTTLPCAFNKVADAADIGFFETSPEKVAIIIDEP
jgi:hypothetical protein